MKIKQTCEATNDMNCWCTGSVQYYPFRNATCGRDYYVRVCADADERAKFCGIDGTNCTARCREYNGEEFCYQAHWCTCGDTSADDRDEILFTNEELRSDYLVPEGYPENGQRYYRGCARYTQGDICRVAMPRATMFFFRNADMFNVNFTDAEDVAAALGVCLRNSDAAQNIGASMDDGVGFFSFVNEILLSDSINDTNTVNCGLFTKSIASDCTRELSDECVERCTCFPGTGKVNGTAQDCNGFYRPCEAFEVAVYCGDAERYTSCNVSCLPDEPRECTLVNGTCSSDVAMRRVEDVNEQDLRTESGELLRVCNVTEASTYCGEGVLACYMRSETGTHVSDSCKCDPRVSVYDASRRLGVPCVWFADHTRLCTANEAVLCGDKGVIACHMRTAYVPDELAVVEPREGEVYFAHTDGVVHMLDLQSYLHTRVVTSPGGSVANAVLGEFHEFHECTCATHPYSALLLPGFFGAFRVTNESLTRLDDVVVRAVEEDLIPDQYFEYVTTKATLNVLEPSLEVRAGSASARCFFNFDAQRLSAWYRYGLCPTDAETGFACYGRGTCVDDESIYEGGLSSETFDCATQLFVGGEVGLSEYHRYLALRDEDLVWKPYRGTQWAYTHEPLAQTAYLVSRGGATANKTHLLQNQVMGYMPLCVADARDNTSDVSGYKRVLRQLSQRPVKLFETPISRAEVNIMLQQLSLNNIGTPVTPRQEFDDDMVRPSNAPPIVDCFSRTLLSEGVGEQLVQQDNSTFGDVRRLLFEDSHLTCVPYDHYTLEFSTSTCENTKAQYQLVLESLASIENTFFTFYMFTESVDSIHPLPETYMEYLTRAGSITTESPDEATDVLVSSSMDVRMRCSFDAENSEFVRFLRSTDAFGLSRSVFDTPVDGRTRIRYGPTDYFPLSDFNVAPWKTWDIHMFNDYRPSTVTYTLTNDTVMETEEADELVEAYRSIVNITQSTGWSPQLDTGVAWGYPGWVKWVCIRNDSCAESAKPTEEYPGYLRFLHDSIYMAGRLNRELPVECVQTGSNSNLWSCKYAYWASAPVTGSGITRNSTRSWQWTALGPSGGQLTYTETSVLYELFRDVIGVILYGVSRKESMRLLSEVTSTSMKNAMPYFGVGEASSVESWLAKAVYRCILVQLPCLESVVTTAGDFSLSSIRGTFTRREGFASRVYSFATFDPFDYGNVGLILFLEEVGRAASTSCEPFISGGCLSQNFDGAVGEVLTSYGLASAEYDADKAAVAALVKEFFIHRNGFYYKNDRTDYVCSEKLTPTDSVIDAAGAPTGETVMDTEPAPCTPNKCQYCLPGFAGDDCSERDFTTDHELIFESFHQISCVLNGTQNCCPGNTCIIPVNYTGRDECVHGTYDWIVGQCVCDPGWSYGCELFTGYTRPEERCLVSWCMTNPTGATGIAGCLTGDVCSGRGTCVGASSCECDNGYTGNLCQFDLLDLCPVHDGKICNNHGDCEIVRVGGELTVLDGNYTGVCRCDSYVNGLFTGTACETVAHVRESECQANGGTSTFRASPGINTTTGRQQGVIYCECDPDTPAIGYVCEYTKCPSVDDVVCNGLSTCVKDTSLNSDGRWTCLHKDDEKGHYKCSNDTQNRYAGCACEFDRFDWCVEPGTSIICSGDYPSSARPEDVCRAYLNPLTGNTEFRCQCSSTRYGQFCEKSRCLEYMPREIIATMRRDATGQEIACNRQSQCKSDGRCNATCVCDTNVANTEKLYAGEYCQFDVTSACGYRTSDGRIKLCNGHGTCQCNGTEFLNSCLNGAFSCVCDEGSTGSKCQATDCPGDCVHGDCVKVSATTYECDCHHPSVWGLSGNGTCTLDVCGATYAGSEPSVRNDKCVCTDPYEVFVNGVGCQTRRCPTYLGVSCGPLHFKDVLVGGSNNEDSSLYRLCSLTGDCVCNGGYVKAANPENATQEVCLPYCNQTNTLDMSILGGVTTCICKAGYTGTVCDEAYCLNGGVVDAFNRSKCVDCAFPWGGLRCNDSACVNGDMNVNETGCDCDEGYTGDLCDKIIVGYFNVTTNTSDTSSGGDSVVVVVSELTCLNGGVLLPSGKCQCVNGWSGEVCDRSFCGHPDSGSRVCLSGGACVCVCDESRGFQLDPVLKTCYHTSCGIRSYYNGTSNGVVQCVCNSTALTAAEQANGCQLDCGANGVYEARTGTCVCGVGYYGIRCGFSYSTSIGQTVNASVTIVVNATSNTTLAVSPVDPSVIFDTRYNNSGGQLFFVGDEIGNHTANQPCVTRRNPDLAAVSECVVVEEDDVLPEYGAPSSYDGYTGVVVDTNYIFYAFWSVYGAVCLFILVLGELLNKS